MAVATRHVRKLRFTDHRGNNIHDLFYVRLLVYTRLYYSRANLIDDRLSRVSPFRRGSVNHRGSN